VAVAYLGAIRFDLVSRRAEHRASEGDLVSGLEIDNQLVLGRRLHREVARLLALEDPIDVAGSAPVLVDPIRPVGD
jgi:hypothetical protein